MFNNLLKQIKLKKEASILLHKYKQLLVSHEHNMVMLQQIQCKCLELGDITKDICIEIESTLYKGELCKKRMLIVIDSLIEGDYKYLKQQANIAAQASNDYTLQSHNIYIKIQELEDKLKRA